ncbi:MAG: hypothetical protein EAZ89_09535, partial [Bacteroidetes bacterium]
ISWVFAGAPAVADGSQIPSAQLEKILKTSANYQLLSNGLAYPYFFMTLSAKLRTILASGVQAAITAKKNLWSLDKTMTGIELKQLSQLTGEHLVFPYLFRRLVKSQFLGMMQDYWKAVLEQKPYTPQTESLFLDRFFEESNPYIFLIKEKDFVRLDSVAEISGSQFKLKTPASNIVFLS